MLETTNSISRAEHDVTLISAGIAVAVIIAAAVAVQAVAAIIPSIAGGAAAPSG